MGKRRSLYSEVKATQAACLLLELNAGEIDYAKCIKLLYSIEREALNRWMRPVIYDDLYSMPYGQVVSRTLDRAEHREIPPQSFWGKHIKRDEQNNLRLVKECGRSKLSRAEISLIEEIFEKNKDKTPKQLFNDHHNPALFPEYKDPHGSSIETTYSYLLRILGKTQEEIKEFEADLDKLASVRDLAE
jgi:hypothetical protein